jgi:hypothetical protein
MMKGLGVCGGFGFGFGFGLGIYQLASDCS